MEALLERGYTVMLETGGHVTIERVPEAVIKIIDIKTPDSREADTFRWENLELAQPHDEFKFVIASRSDYEWSREVVRERFENRPNPVLFSPSHEELPAKDLAAWILRRQPARSPSTAGPQVHMGSRRSGRVNPFDLSRFKTHKI